MSCRPLAFVWLALCLASVSGWSQEPPAAPKAAITDQNGNPLPETMPLGECLYFSAKQAQHAGGPGSIRWIVKPQARAARSGEFEDSQILCVPTGLTPVVLEITQVVTLGDVIDIAEIRIQLGDPKPKPDPVDPDQVIPDPVIPDVDPGRYGLAAISRAGMAKVTSSAKATEAAAIAQAHREAVDAARKQPFGLTAALQADLKLRIAAALDLAARTRWAAWAEHVDVKTRELQTAGTLTTRNDWLDAYSEIANGLKGGK